MFRYLRVNVLVAIGSAARPRGELANLLTASYPASRLGDMVLDEVASSQLQRVIKEQRQLARIKEHGLTPRRKLLLVGPPGTGKTMTAAALAGELGTPLFLVRHSIGKIAASAPVSYATSRRSQTTCRSLALKLTSSDRSATRFQASWPKCWPVRSSSSSSEVRHSGLTRD